MKQQRAAQPQEPRPPRTGPDVPRPPQAGPVVAGLKEAGPEETRRSEPAGAVARGMPVIDAAGLPVGTVAQVRPGDPDAVTVQPPTPGATGPLDELIAATASGEPDVPAETAARLLRRGYLKIDTGRAGEEPLYVANDLVDRVQDQRVRLTVLAASLTPPG